MHYYVDGYNLMFQVLRAGDDLKKQREEIVVDLDRKVHLLHLELTLVFDSKYHPGELERTHVREMEIIYSSEGETADECILDLLKAESDPQHVTVVTSDNKLAWLARRLRAKTEKVPDFLSWINKRYKNRVLALKKPKLERVEPPRLVKKPESEEEHYLKVFEEHYKEIAEEEPIQPTQKKKTKKVPKEKPTEESDMERWMRAFERDPEKENGA